MRDELVDRLASIISATTPLVAAADMLVPLSDMYVRVATSTLYAG